MSKAWRAAATLTDDKDGHVLGSTSDERSDNEDLQS